MNLRIDTKQIRQVPGKQRQCATKNVSPTSCQAKARRTNPIGAAGCFAKTRLEHSEIDSPVLMYD